ncbi:GNAT family N-acetyltransferase [Oceanobacillus jeddahense]|uniref:GNAT family N-acetyltransferase n=1 Tax=Oceanobacillus jeddahense TaxID=1462527 RepID=UPI000595F077|nr:GNAT family protein [Oceanobacillus jeddahense]
MQKVEKITLKLLSKTYIDYLYQFKLSEEQHQFTALPQEVSELTEGQYGVMIMHYEEPVGFFLLHQTERVKEYSDNPNAMLLTALSINEIHQRKGYAREGMILLTNFVKDVFPACDEIVLAVNHRNVPAQKLYSNAGFLDTEKRKEGPKGEQYIMALQIP